MRFSIELQRGARAGLVRRLGVGMRRPLRDWLVVGRSSDCDVVVDLPGVAERRHLVFHLDGARCEVALGDSAGAVVIDGRELRRGRARLRPGSLIELLPGVVLRVVVDEAPLALLDLTTVDRFHELLLFDPVATTDGLTVWRAVPVVDTGAVPILVLAEHDPETGLHLRELDDDAGVRASAVADFAGLSVAQLLGLTAQSAGARIPHDVVAGIVRPIARRLATDPGLRLHLDHHDVGVSWDGDVRLFGIGELPLFGHDELRRRAPMDTGLVEVASLGVLTFDLLGRGARGAPGDRRAPPMGLAVGPGGDAMSRFVTGLDVDPEVADLLAATFEVAHRGPRRRTRASLVEAFETWLQVQLLESIDDDVDLGAFIRAVDPEGAARDRLVREQLALLDEEGARRLVDLVAPRRLGG